MSSALPSERPRRLFANLPARHVNSRTIRALRLWVVIVICAALIVVPAWYFVQPSFDGVHDGKTALGRSESEPAS